MRRSLRNRLAVIFGLIVAAAIGGVYLSVAPELEDRLRADKLETLAREAERAAPRLSEPTIDAVRAAAGRTSVEVAILEVFRSGTQDPTLYPRYDSAGGRGLDLRLARDLALEALRTGRTATGTEPTEAGRQALAAISLAGGEYVAVFADALDDVQNTVSLIRRQILVSGGVALIIAVLAGFLVARRLSERVARLERAARRVAEGDFSNRIQADAEDELGQLAAAFDDMQRQLARLDTARKRFIASASHELRTPIFSLGGFLELLADEDLDEETRRQFLDQLRGQVDRMRKLATELLDLSRLESGALELRPEPTDVGELAREVASEFTPAAQSHCAELDVRLGSEAIEIEIDPERVAQVLRILLDNAIVHTPAGTGIVVSAAREDGHVRLDVSDRGLGIKRQTMPHIFDPFFTSNDNAQGAGLGLTIARELAERMHGRLDVRSVPGSTTFSLVLPS
jgi:two-component system OmpR family sensor kinase